MGLTKGNILSIIFIAMLVLNLFAALQVKEKYELAKESCDECWNYSQGCEWRIEVYNLSGLNISHDDLTALGEEQG